MAIPLKGRVRGNIVTLDAPVPPLEGKRVLVALEAAEEPELAAENNATAWAGWVAAGPQGPIDVEGEPDFP